MDPDRIRRLRCWMVGARLTATSIGADRECVLCGRRGVLGHDLAPVAVGDDEDSLDGVERAMEVEDRLGIKLSDDADDHWPEPDAKEPVCGECILMFADALEWE